MNNLNEWIPHLQHPLVLAGFGLFVFAAIIRLLFLHTKKLTGPVLVPLLNKAMILLFVLAVLVIIAGFALSWKATPAATPKLVEKPVAAEGIGQYEQRLRVVEQGLLAMQAEVAPGDDKEHRLLAEKLKVVQAKLADVQKSWKEEQKLHQETKVDLAQLKGLLPDEQLKKAEKSLAQGDKEEAEQAFDAVAEKEGEVVALAAHRSGKLAEDRLDYEKAMRQYKKAVALEENNPDYLLAAGDMARMVADYAQAQEWLERLLHIREKEKKDSPELALAQNNLAWLYEKQGKYAEAEPLYKRSLEIREQKLGKDHPDVAATLNNLAWLYYGQGRYKEAEPLSERALEIREQKLGKDHPDVAYTLNNLAKLYKSQYRYEAAEPLYKRALEIREQKLGKDHPAVADTLNNLAALYESQGRYEAAEPLYKRALEIREQKLGKDHPYVATTLNNLAGLHKAQGKYTEAEPLYQRAIAIMKAKFPGGHPNLDVFQKNYDNLKRKQVGQ